MAKLQGQGPSLQPLTVKIVNCHAPFNKLALIKTEFEQPFT